MHEDRTWLQSPRHEALWASIAAQLETGDLSHDAQHVRRVYVWAIALCAEAGADPELAGAAALVHDLVQVPKEAPARADAARRSAAEAPPALVQAGYAADEIDEIVVAVRSCSWSSGLAPDSALGRVLQDADRLDAIGALGIARTFACAQAIAGRGRALRLHCDDDPVCALGRPPDEARYAVDHFMVKLLKLAAGMHLPSARAEARRRQALMQSFLAELARECATPDDEALLGMPVLDTSPSA